MVMSQADIDALMVQGSDKDAGAEDAETDAALEALDTAVSEELPNEGDSELTEEEKAIVAEVANETAEAPAEIPKAEPAAEALAADAPAADAPTAEAPAAEAPATVSSPGPETPSVKITTYAAGATPESDQLKTRLQEMEEKLVALEASSAAGAAPGVEPEALAELKQGLEQINATIQTLWTTVHQLTEHSQGSLGFAAKQTFDCPECGSHGTVSVPISCTNCGHETEWGFFPEQ